VVGEDSCVVAGTSPVTYCSAEWILTPSPIAMTYAWSKVVRSWFSFTIGEISMTQTPDRYRESRDVWKDCNHRQEFEHDLINHQASWSLTGQTILFAAYGLSLRSDFVDESNEFRKVIAISGFAISVVIFVGVLALINSKRILWLDYRHLYSHLAKEVRLPRPADERPHQWGVRTVNTLFTLLPDVLLPVIFALAWLFLLTRS
jgi:hypothetical protein